MHWGFYVVAVLVTAFAIYVQVKRVEKAEKQNERVAPSPEPAARKSGMKEE